MAGTPQREIFGASLIRIGFGRDVLLRGAFTLDERISLRLVWHVVASMLRVDYLRVSLFGALMTAAVLFNIGQP
jgi:hypothetical protein